MSPKNGPKNEPKKWLKRYGPKIESGRTKTDENGRYQMLQCTKVDDFSERSLDILESQKSTWN